MVVGLYVHEGSDWSTARRKLNACRLIEQLDQKIIKTVDCVLVDVRSNAENVLPSVACYSHAVPLIALADLSQSFAPAYPYGCYLQNHTTIDELGSTLFDYKLREAKSAYAEPIHTGSKGSPYYALLQDIVDYSSDWIIVKDLDHRFLLATENFADLAGVEIDQLIGKDDLEIGTPPEQVHGTPDGKLTGFWPQDDAVTNSGQPSVEENPYWDLFSHEHRYRRTIRAPLQNYRGEIYGLLVCSKDITEQKRNESLLEEGKAMLAQVTEEKRNAEHNRMRAEEAVAAKTRFLAAASHDLRQPLHAMGLFLHILNKRTKGKPEQQLVQQIQQSCTTLNNLFTGCLDISKLDAGIVERKDQNFRLSSFLDELHQGLMQQAQEKGLQYIYKSDDLTVHSDAMLLGRIFRNLVNNAIQYTDKGSISVTTTLQDDIVMLAITDTGRGIPENETTRIFSEFHQINADDARMGRGLGLGLAIVKRLCKLLEIELSLESVLGQGSTFTLQIPAGSAASVSSEEKNPTTINLQGARVLIIDDDKYIRAGMETLLQANGCETFSAADASLARSSLQRSNVIPSIIVADYHLSDGNTGTAAIQEIRSFCGQQTPALLVTGDTTADSEKDAMKHGLRVLYKPVTSEVLLSTIADELVQNAAVPASSPEYS